MANLHSHLLAVQYQISPPGSNIPADGKAATTAAEKLISQVIGVLTIIAALYFVIQIILAGYAFMSSQGDTGKMETARTRLTQSVLGLTIVVIALAVGAFIAYLLGIKNIFSLEAMFTKMGL